MRGTKRKIAMEKIQKKESRSVAFSKRRNGLFSKASEFCQLSGAQIAILVTPVSSKSNVGFYSYGYSSVDSVVSNFLADDRLPPKQDSRFWFEDETLIEKLDDLTELNEAVDSISRMLQNLRGMCPDLGFQEEVVKKSGVVLDGTQQELSETQTLIHQSASTSHCTEGLVQNQISLTSDDGNNGLPLKLDSCNQQTDLEMNWEDMRLNFEMDEVLMNQTPFDNDNTNGFLGDLDVFNQELDVDQFIDFDMDEVFILPKLVEEESLKKHRDSDALPEELNR